MRRLFLISICQFLIMTVAWSNDPMYPVKTLKAAFKLAHKTWPEASLSIEPFFSGKDYNPELTEYDTLFRCFNAGNDAGWLVVSSAQGRFERFDFAAVYSMEAELLRLRVLNYRSEYGSQISSRAWLKNFYGKQTGEPFVYGQDIDALSGATLSAQSMTDAVNRLNKIVAGIK